MRHGGHGRFGRYRYPKGLLFSSALSFSNLIALLQLMAQMGDQGGAGAGPSGALDVDAGDSDSDDGGPPPLE